MAEAAGGVRRHRALKSAAAIIAVGGDGTLRTVIDRALSLAGGTPLPPVLFVGLGTANVMQKHLKLRYPKTGVAEKVMRLLLAKKTRAVDIGTAGGQAFLLMTSVGYDAGVVHAVAKARCGPITKFSYVLPAIQQLREQAYSNVTVTVDGRTIHADAPGQVFVGNVAEYGTGMPILTTADSGDGLLDVCVIPCAGHLEFAKMVWLLASGGHRNAPGVIYARGRDVTIDADTPLPVQIDGDPAGLTPVRLGLLARRVDFIVP
ncbi:MAG: diacylglycerol kinase family protein [Tepidisphaeraceae bacterium]